MMALQYREVQGFFTARVPDSGDADLNPDTIPLAGAVTFHPEYRKPLVFPGEHIVVEPISAVIVDGHLMREVMQGEETVLQALRLPVTMDERANQTWSWRLRFSGVQLGEYGETVDLPEVRFVIEEGDEPLDLSTVPQTTARAASTFITRGPRGYSITGVTATNGELVLEWEGGRTDNVPMPDAVQGVGVEDTRQVSPSSVAFDLTDGTTTSFVDLPHGPPGRDGSNVLPSRTAVLSEAEQPDFVGMAQSKSHYKTMTVTPSSAGGLLVRCLSGGPTDDQVSYEITPGPRYRLISSITEYSSERGEYYVPDPLESDAMHAGDRRHDDFTLGGAWTTATTWFTTQVGATWETTITTHNPGDTVFMSFFTDNRGGIWKIDLVEDVSVSANISTFRSSSSTSSGYRIFSVPNPGTYTLRGTFVGADPSNPPSSGTARGWLTSGGFPRYVVRVSEVMIGSGVLSPGSSNKNWAFQVSHPEVGGSQFFPYHGQNVETIVSPPEFFDGAKRLDVSSMSAGEPVEVGELTMVQHIQCHNSASPDELVDVRTVDTIKADGTYRAEGRIEVLHDLVSTHQMYTGMLPFNPAELDTVVTSFRNGHPAGTDMAGQSATRLGAEGLHAKSLAMVCDDPGVAAAVRFNTPEETRRMSASANFGHPTRTPIFIEHRSETLGKVYPRFGYLDGTLVPSGTVWRFSVDYWFGRIPGIRHLIE